MKLSFLAMSFVMFVSNASFAEHLATSIYIAHSDGVKAPGGSLIEAGVQADTRFSELFTTQFGLSAEKSDTDDLFTSDEQREFISVGMLFQEKLFVELKAGSNQSEINTKLGYYFAQNMSISFSKKNDSLHFSDIAERTYEIKYQPADWSVAFKKTDFDNNYELYSFSAEARTGNFTLGVSPSLAEHSSSAYSSWGYAFNVNYNLTPSTKLELIVAPVDAIYEQSFLSLKLKYTL